MGLDSPALSTNITIILLLQSTQKKITIF